MKIFLFPLLDDTFTALFSFLLCRLINAALPVYLFGFFHCIIAAELKHESGIVPPSTFLRTQREPAPFWKEENHEGQQSRPHMYCREGSGPGEEGMGAYPWQIRTGRSIHR